MSCGCYNKEKEADLSRMRSLAKKAARMEGKMYVLFKKNDSTYSFVPEGVDYVGVFIEFVHYL